MARNFSQTRHYAWSTVGTFTAADTTPTVGARDYTSVAALANTVIYGPTEVCLNKIELRFTGDTDGDAPAYDIFAARSNNPTLDNFTRVCTVTLHIGTQQFGAADVLFADDITVSNSNWPTSIVEADNVDEEIARLVFDTVGYSYWAFVPITIPASSSNTIQISGY